MSLPRFETLAAWSRCTSRSLAELASLLDRHIGGVEEDNVVRAYLLLLRSSIHGHRSVLEAVAAEVDPEGRLAPSEEQCRRALGLGFTAVLGLVRLAEAYEGDALRFWRSMLFEDKHMHRALRQLLHALSATYSVLSQVLDDAGGGLALYGAMLRSSARDLMSLESLLSDLRARFLESGSLEFLCAGYASAPNVASVIG